MSIDGYIHQVIDKGGYPAAFVPAWNEPGPGEIDGTEEAKANALLIAAAPDLYAEVKQLQLEVQEAADRLRGILPRTAYLFDKAAERATATLAKAREGSSS